MNNVQKIKNIYMELFKLEDKDVVDDLSYNEIPQWDSTGHMALIAEIEEVFDIMLDTEDILDMSSFAKAKEIIGKYGIDIDA